MVINIKRFGQNDAGTILWYQEEGKNERITTNEVTFNGLWTVWICSSNTFKHEDDKYLIFEFEQPKRIEI